MKNMIKPANRCGCTHTHTHTHTHTQVILKKNGGVEHDTSIF